MLLFANGIRESQVNVLDVAVLNHFHNFGCRHYHSSKINCAENS